MISPNSTWRSKEDLKVILVPPCKTAKLTIPMAASFFERFGRITNCYLLHGNRIACAEYTCEEDAEEALKEDVVRLNNVLCDVTTFKSGNRKIFISPLIVSKRVLREYFESNYGQVVRVEILPGCQFGFILFLKVDSAVACRNKNHIISGCRVFASPGNDKMERKMEPMYRIDQRVTPSNRKDAFSPHRRDISRSSNSNRNENNNVPIPSPPPNNQFTCGFPYCAEPSTESAAPCIPLRVSTNSRFEYRSHSNELPSPSTSESSTDSSRQSEQWNTSSNHFQFSNTSLPIGSLVEEMQDLSIDDSEEDSSQDPNKKQRKKKKKRIVEFESTKLNWKNNLAPVGIQPPKIVLDDKWKRFEKKRVELNLPPIVPGTHYAKDEEGLPLHHNGRYLLSIQKDGRWKMKIANRVTFNLDNNEVKSFERADYEYQFFGSINSSNERNNQNDDDEDDGWGNEEIMTRNMSRDGFPNQLAWPYSFPTKPSHFPLMDNCPNKEEISLLYSSTVKYLHHLEEKWKRSKQTEFLRAMAPFFRTTCNVCDMKLDGTRKQFEHLFSKSHLTNLNRHNVKYSPSDFTFWHTLLLKNFDNGKKRK